MKKLSILICIISMLLFNHNLFGQAENRFPIYCSYNFNEFVSDVDKSLLQSLVEREIRDLGDTRLISEDDFIKTLGALRLDITLLSIQYNGKNVGYALFAIYLENLAIDLGYSTYAGKFYGTDVEIEDFIQPLVAHFDQGKLKPLR